MKLTINKLVFLLIMATGLFSVATVSAFGAGRPNLLIMTEDADSDALPRHSRVVKRVLNTIALQMQDLGFDVYDETVVSLDHFSQQRIRRDRQQLMEIGQSVRHPPIDVVVSFTIYASLTDKGFANQVNTRIEAQMVQVNSGRFLGSFEVSSPKSWHASADCDRECVLEAVGDYAKILANDLGSILAEKLAYRLDGRLYSTEDSLNQADGTGSRHHINGYALLFDNFSPEQVMNMEEYLVVFSGYQSHRPTYASARRAEFWYQSDITSGKLQRNLHKMLERLGLHARISYSGNTFNIEQTVIVARENLAAFGAW